MTKYKIIVFGVGAVGKSPLVIQFVEGYFSTDYDPTIEDLYKYDLEVDGENVQLDILDTAGGDDFAPVRTSYMRQGKGFIIVYTIDDRQSFEEVEVFHRNITRVKGTFFVPVVICGNKCDLEDKRVVSKAEGEELASKLNATFFETSALLNINTREPFIELAKKIHAQEAVKVDDKLLLAIEKELIYASRNGNLHNAKETLSSGQIPINFKGI